MSTHHHRLARVRLELTAWRVVDSGAVTATRKLVDSDDEQRVLDALIDGAEAPETADIAGLHPLLASPFRHPPPPRGSRFGTAAERGVFYAARELHTFLGEVALARFRFFEGTTGRLGPLQTQHLAFQVSLKTSWGADLTRPPPSAPSRRVPARPDHAATQPLGRQLRDDGIELVLFDSVHDPERRAAVAVFSPRAFASSRPLPHAQEWRCFATADRCELRRIAVDLGPALVVRRDEVL